MNMKTIWTIRDMPLRERLNRTGDLLWLKIAHRLPRRLAYWSFIDSGVRHIHDDEVVPEVQYTEILARMDKA